MYTLLTLGYLPVSRKYPNLQCSSACNGTLQSWPTVCTTPALQKSRSMWLKLRAVQSNVSGEPSTSEDGNYYEAPPILAGELPAQSHRVIANRSEK